MTDIDPKIAENYVEAVKVYARTQRSIDKLTLKTTNLKIRIKTIESDVLIDQYHTLKVSKDDIMPTQEEREALLWQELKKDKIYLDAVEKLRRTERLIINLKFKLAKAAANKVVTEARLK
jgi:hypothetical protein